MSETFEGTAGGRLRSLAMPSFSSLEFLPIVITLTEVALRFEL